MKHPPHHRFERPINGTQTHWIPYSYIPSPLFHHSFSLLSNSNDHRHCYSRLQRVLPHRLGALSLRRRHLPRHSCNKLRFKSVTHLINLIHPLRFQVCSLKAMTQSLPLTTNSPFLDADSKNLLSGISTRLNEIDLKLSFVIDLLNGSGASQRPSLDSLSLPPVPVTPTEQQRQLNATMAATLTNMSQVICFSGKNHPQK